MLAAASLLSGCMPETYSEVSVKCDGFVHRIEHKLGTESELNAYSTYLRKFCARSSLAPIQETKHVAAQVFPTPQ